MDQVDKVLIVVLVLVGWPLLGCVMLASVDDGELLEWYKRGQEEFGLGLIADVVVVFFWPVWFVHTIRRRWFSKD